MRNRRVHSQFSIFSSLRRLLIKLVQFNGSIRLAALATAEAKEVLSTGPIEDLRVAEGIVLVGSQQFLVLVWCTALYSGSFRSLGALV